MQCSNNKSNGNYSSSALDDSRRSRTTACSSLGESSTSDIRTPLRQDARLIRNMGELPMPESPFLSPGLSPTPSLSTASSSRCKRVRFDREISKVEVPSLASLSIEDRRRTWWTETEVATIERDVCSIANLIDLNRLPESKSTYGHVRGAVAYTNKALRNRSAQRDQLYEEISAIQSMHQEEPTLDTFERAAKQSLKRILIARMSQNISETSTKHAQEIARLDAEQADLVYQEEFEETTGEPELDDKQRDEKESASSNRSPVTTTLLSNE